MFPQISEILFGNISPTDSHINSSLQTYMVTDEVRTDGAFVLHHFLSTFAKEAAPICLVTLAQTLSHYSLVASKLASNLAPLLQSSSLRTIDGLTKIGDALLLLESLSEKPTCDWSLVPGASLRPLYDAVVSEMESFDSSRNNSLRRLLLIDDLSLLLSLGNTTRDVAAFVLHLRRRFDSHPVTVVFLFHGDLEEEDEDRMSLTKLLEHQVDVCVQVRGLPTGFCRDVHGRISIIKKSVSNEDVEHKSSVERHFKISDKNVVLFAPGLSAAVL